MIDCFMMDAMLLAGLVPRPTAMDGEQYGSFTRCFSCSLTRGHPMSVSVYGTMQSLFLPYPSFLFLFPTSFFHVALLPIRTCSRHAPFPLDPFFFFGSLCCCFFAARPSSTVSPPTYALLSRILSAVLRCSRRFFAFLLISGSNVHFPQKARTGHALCILLALRKTPRGDVRSECRTGTGRTCAGTSPAERVRAVHVQQSFSSTSSATRIRGASADVPAREPTPDSDAWTGGEKKSVQEDRAGAESMSMFYSAAVDRDSAMGMRKGRRTRLQLGGG